MALPIITIKNIDSITRNACGIRFLAGQEIEIEPYDKLALSENQDFLSALADGYFEIYYDGYPLSVETGESVLRNHVYVKIDGVDLGYAHTIDFKGIFGVVGQGAGGSLEVETGSEVSIEDIQNLNLILDGYQTKIVHNTDIENLLAHLDAYMAPHLDAYHPDITGQEHYEQLSSAIQTILKELDGYSGGAGTDIKVKVSSNDTTAGYLIEKILAGHGISISTDNAGGNESLRISSDIRLDGYASDQTVSEHYKQHSDAIQTILKELDGYGTGGFGAGFMYVENLAQSETTSDAWQTKATLTSPALTGTYLVEWMAIATQKNFPAEYRLWNDTDSTEYMQHSIDDNAPPPGNNRHVGGFTTVTFSGSPKVFKVQWRSTVNAKIAYIKDAKIMIWSTG